MATRTIAPTAGAQGSQASRTSTPSNIPRPTFGSVAYRRNDTSVFHTPFNSIMNSANSRDSVPIDRSPSEAMARNRINEPSPSPGHSLFSREQSEPSVSQEDLVDEMNAVAINRGKRPLRNFGVPSMSTSQDELGREDSGGDPDGNGPPSEPDNEGPSPNNSDDERDSRYDPHERARFTSLEPALAQKREWTYDPTPQSREELLLAAFGPIEELIRSTLHSSPDGGNSNIQKTLIQSLPKPGTYGGENDMTIFDNWVKDFVRWLSIAGLNGREVRWSYTKSSYVLTSVDIQCTNAVSMFLASNAKRWLHDVVEKIPDATARNEPLQGQYTFLQVIAGLYRRFIHDASLNKVADMYDSVTYSQSQGVEGLFEKLKNLALHLPTPPDAYNFRKCLMLLIPEHIGNVMTSIHKVTAEKSTLTEIMETAISIEQGEAAREYYQEACRRLERTRRKSSRSRSQNCRRSRSRKCGNNNSHGSSKRSGSPKRLQVVDGRRYSVKPYNQWRDD
ncbi:hypothetical protein L218DRAFT_1081456 [Marasmius fiardii PR-910]|nr:hypothetical protein L218DRAFT_1081456 [Marasmius fiardii PR-910]